MNKIAQKMLHHKKGIVALFAVLAVLCALLSRRVKVDYNMMHYLPKDAPSTIALDVMEEEYSAKTANCRIMIEDAAIPEALALKKQLQQVPGVSEVMWLDDYANVYAPLETLDGDTVESWYKEGNVLFTCYVDEDDLYSHLMDIRAVVGEDAAMSGEAVNTGMATESTTRELKMVMAIALPLVFLILLLTTTSWFEPVLFMATIGVAIVLNMGTNLAFGTISFVTNAAGSVLQLAVSMDYSIFLLHSFSRFRASGMDVQDAMSHAVKDSFSSVTSSALTTVIGFAALILMRFRIGPDMGVVMAKAIVFSLLCVLVFLPCLAVLCYKLIDKTQHRSFIPTFRGFSYFVMKVKVAYLIINTVQLGATVDYAILFTNKYLENRRENSRWHAARITVRETVVSILTSGSILCIAGSMLGALSTNGVISQLGYLVGRGAVLSCCMVLFVLPTCLCLFDGLVQKLCYSYALFRQQSRHCAGDGPRLHERGKRGRRRLLHEAFSR